MGAQGSKPYRNAYVVKVTLRDGRIGEPVEYANPVTFAKLSGRGRQAWVSRFAPATARVRNGRSYQIGSRMASLKALPNQYSLTAASML